MIGVLSENHDFNLVQVSRKSAEDLRFSWKNRFRLISFVEKLAQLLKIGLRKLRVEKVFPAVVHIIF